jgi:hypothetical protein
MVRLLPFVVCLLCAPGIGATVLVPAEFREIVAGSETIAYTRVVAVRPEWVEGRRQIDTIVTAEVIASYKGEPARSVSFRVPGGQIGRYRSILVGAPVFSRGDEAVLFLQSADGDVARVFGLNQGVFRVRVDARSGRRIVVRPALLASGEAAERVVRGAASRRAVDLDAFGAQVRAAMAAPRNQAGSAR